MASLALQNEAGEVAKQLFGSRKAARADFTRHLLEIYDRAQDKDFLVIHNPGGWGCSRLDRCLDWERSIVEGVENTIDHLGYSSIMTQYFRTRDTLWAHFMDTREQVRFFLQGRYSKAKILATELKFLAEHTDRLHIIMIGVSQGAGFSNAVMRQLGEEHAIYSIELGTMFIHVPRRISNDHTLAIDSNGILPDPFVHRDFWAGISAYAAAGVRWLKYQIIRKPKRFTRCVNMPGHDYSWEYPGVKLKIESFLNTRFGRNVEERKQ
jgi:hypothetical protein